MSLPLWFRVAVTAPVVVLELLLLRAVVIIAQEDDPRPAALGLFFMASVAAVTGPFLREMWRSSVEWKQDRTRDHGVERLRAEELRTREPLPQFTDFSGPDD